MHEEPLQILVVEDDPKVAYNISTGIESENLHAIRCHSGVQALDHFERTPVDLVLLDLGLPDIDGMEVLRAIRAKNLSIPVLILTARDAVHDRIAGLDGGADDYLVKPFSLAELQARLRALTRRVDLGRQPLRHCADLNLDAASRSATRNGESLELSPREFDLLLYLMEHEGQVVTRTMLAEDVWKYNSRVTPIDNIIDVQISRLREKIDKPFDTWLLHTVRGVGFKLEAPGHSP